LNGIQEVRGSIPLISTTKKNLSNGRFFFVVKRRAEKLFGGVYKLNGAFYEYNNVELDIRHIL